MRNRARRGVGLALALLAVWAVLAAGAYVIAQPYRAPAPGPHILLTSYLAPAGSSVLVRMSGPGAVGPGWISESFEALPGLRALTELPAAFVTELNKVVTGIVAPPVDTAKRMFANVDVELQWIEQIDATGAPTFRTAVTLLDRHGLYLVGELDTGQGASRYDPPMLDLPATPSVGATWSSAGTQGAGTYRSTARVLGHGPQATPVGRYDDCITTENVIVRSVSGQTQTQRSRTVSCRGVGDVLTDLLQPSPARYEIVARPGRSSGTGALSRPAPPPRTSVSDPATWRLSRVARLGPAGSGAEPTFAPEAIGTDPALVIGATEHVDGISATVASGASVGKTAWSFATGGRVFGAPRFDPVHGRLFFGASDKRLYGLDARGLFLWSHETRDNVVARPLVFGDLVVGASEDGTVVGLDGATGRLRWRFDAGAAVVADPVLVGGTVVIGTDGGMVVGLDPASGRQRWSADLGAPVQSPIASTADSVVVATASGTTSRIAGSGAEIWSEEGGDASSGPAAGRLGTALVNDHGELVGRDLGDGSERWRIGNRGYIGVPALTDRGYVVARAIGRLDLVGFDGRLLRTWDLRTVRDATDAAPEVRLGPRSSGDGLVIADRDGVVMRLGPADGTTPGSLSLRAIARPGSQRPFDGTPVASTPAAWRGRTLLLSAAGRLYASDPATGAAEAVAAPAHVGVALNAPIVVGDDALVAFSGTTATSPGTVLRVHLPTGRTVWSHTVVGATEQPALVGDGLFVHARRVTGGSVVEALDVRDGSVRWSHPSGVLSLLGSRPFEAPGPVSDGRTVYAGVPLTAYDLPTGAVRWTATAAPGAEGGLALSPDGRAAYLASADVTGTVGIVAAVDTGTGAVAWRTTLPAGFMAQSGHLLATDRTVVVSTSSPDAVLGLDASSGRLRWAVSLPAARVGSAALIGSRVWTVIEHGRTIAVDADTGVVAALFPGLGDEVELASGVQAPAPIGRDVVVAGGSAVYSLATGGGR